MHKLLSLIAGLLPVAAFLVPQSANASTEMPRPEIFAESRFGFEETVAEVKKAVEAEGMTVVFELDIQKRVAAKGLSQPPTLVLGVCSAKHADAALQNDPTIAPNLPCRISIREQGDKVMVGTQNAELMGAKYSGPTMKQVAGEIHVHLTNVLRAVSK